MDAAARPARMLSVLGRQNHNILLITRFSCDICPNYSSLSNSDIPQISENLSLSIFLSLSHSHFLYLAISVSHSLSLCLSMSFSLSLKAFILISFKVLEPFRFCRVGDLGEKKSNVDLKVDCFFTSYVSCDKIVLLNI